MANAANIPLLGNLIVPLPFDTSEQHKQNVRDNGCQADQQLQPKWLQTGCNLNTAFASGRYGCSCVHRPTVVVTFELKARRNANAAGLLFMRMLTGGRDKARNSTARYHCAGEVMATELRPGPNGQATS